MAKKDVIEVVDVRDAIMEHLKEIERNLNWLATKTGILYSTMYSIFVQKTFNPTQEKMDSINKVLGTEFKTNKEQAI